MTFTVRLSEKLSSSTNIVFRKKLIPQLTISCIARIVLDIGGRSIRFTFLGAVKRISPLMITKLTLPSEMRTSTVTSLFLPYTIGVQRALFTSLLEKFSTLEPITYRSIIGT